MRCRLDTDMLVRVEVIRLKSKANIFQGCLQATGTWVNVPVLVFRLYLI